MLVPSARLVETPDEMHFYDGRRLVSLAVDPAARAAVHTALGSPHRAACAASGEHADVDDAEQLLSTLGLTAPDDGGSWRGEIGAQYAFTTAGAAPTAAAERCVGTTVHVLSDDVADLSRCLTESGLRCRALIDTSGTADIGAAVAALDPRHDLVVATALDNRPIDRLRLVNDACLEHGVPWLPVSAYDGSVLHVGPLTFPRETACYECTLRRLAANTAFADLFDDVVALAPAAPTPRALRTLAYSVAALTLLHWIAGRDPEVPGLLVTVDPAHLALRQSRIFRVPRCAACAGPDYVTAAAPWELARDH